MPQQNLPAAPRAGSAPALAMDPSLIDPDYYVHHFMEFMPRYIAHGNPSKDTRDNYTACIKHFIDWCAEKKMHPLAVTDYPMRIYRETLVQKGYRRTYIHFILVALRAFFHTAKMMGLIKENPCADISAPPVDMNEFIISAYTPEQLREIRDVFSGEPDDFLRLRNTVILYLMAIEGLRNVEVHRACREDIDWTNNVMYIRGKGSRGRMDPIFPCDQTMEYLKQYVAAADAIPGKKIKKDGNLTPLILSDSNRNELGRISRAGLRWIMNKALEAANLKNLGFSCHVLRHSCGTNLYQKTKDLRLVQDTLRHRDPKVTARYAHVVNRLSHRATSALADMMDVSTEKETKD